MKSVLLNHDIYVAVKKCWIRVLCHEKLCVKAVISFCLCVNFSETLLGFDHTVHPLILFTLYCEVSWFWTIIAEFHLRVSLLVPCVVQIGTWLFLLTGIGTQFNCKQHYGCLSAKEDDAFCCTRLVEGLS